jgi:hypothetical protein
MHVLLLLAVASESFVSSPSTSRENAAIIHRSVYGQDTGKSVDKGELVKEVLPPKRASSHHARLHAALVPTSSASPAQPTRDQFLGLCFLGEIERSFVPPCPVWLEAWVGQPWVQDRHKLGNCCARHHSFIGNRLSMMYSALAPSSKQTKVLELWRRTIDRVVPSSTWWPNCLSVRACPLFIA